MNNEICYKINNTYLWLPKILNYKWFTEFKNNILAKHYGVDQSCDTYENTSFIPNKYIGLFNLSQIKQYNYNLIQFKNLNNIKTFKNICQKIKNKDLAQKLKHKVQLLYSINKKIIIFNCEYLIKNNQFNQIFNQYLDSKFIEKYALNISGYVRNDKYLLYSKFFNYFFNFIIYKAQTQHNQKFGFNSLMSIKAGQKIQQSNLNEIYIYIHKDLGKEELNRQLSYIINRILEN